MDASMSDWNRRNRIRETIGRFIKVGDQIPFWAGMLELGESKLQNPAPFDSPDDTLEFVRMAHTRNAAAAAEFHKLTPILAEELEAIGEDSTDVLKVGHAPTGGGGFFGNLDPVWHARERGWLDLKAQLRRIDIRQHIGAGSDGTL